MISSKIIIVSVFMFLIIGQMPVSIFGQQIINIPSTAYEEKPSTFSLTAFDNQHGEVFLCFLPRLEMQ